MAHFSGPLGEGKRQRLQVLELLWWEQSLFSLGDLDALTDRSLELVLLQNEQKSSVLVLD